MRNSILYVVGAVVLLGGGAFLFLKNKNKKDLLKLKDSALENLGGSTPGGATSSGTTTGGAKSSGTSSSLSTTSDGVSPSDANINLANATILVGQRTILEGKTKSPYTQSRSGNQTTDRLNLIDYVTEKTLANTQLVELDKKLATLGYKVDAIGQLVKI